jgi:hypothetical protein
VARLQMQISIIMRTKAWLAWSRLPLHPSSFDFPAGEPSNLGRMGPGDIIFFRRGYNYPILTTAAWIRHGNAHFPIRRYGTASNFPGRQRELIITRISTVCTLLLARICLPPWGIPPTAWGSRTCAGLLVSEARAYRPGNPPSVLDSMHSHGPDQNGRYFRYQPSL